MQSDADAQVNTTLRLSGQVGGSLQKEAGQVMLHE